MDRAMMVGLGASLAVLLFVLELVRRRKLREEYSLLWLATALVLLILSLSRPLLDVLAEAVGIFYPPSALFLVALAFIMFILLHFSTVLTRLAQQNKELAQQLALLRYEVEQARQQSTPSAQDENRPNQNTEQSGTVDG